VLIPPEPESNRVTRLRYRKGGEEKVVEEEERLAGRVITWWRPCMQLGSRPARINQPPINNAFCYHERLKKVPASDAQPQSTQPAQRALSAQLSPEMACS